MDYKYALDIMEQELKSQYICPEVKYAFKASIKALEKQIAKENANKSRTIQEFVQNLINTHKDDYIKTGELSDGYHTFDELYFHRMVLFSVVCNMNTYYSWKSWKHHDGTMYDDYFIVGVNTPEGQYSYHCHKDHWDDFKVKELDSAPEWDGHEPSDVTRLSSLC